jgi:hypothetical protein
MIALTKRSVAPSSTKLWACCNVVASSSAAVYALVARTYRIPAVIADPMASPPVSSNQLLVVSVA